MIPFTCRVFILDNVCDFLLLLGKLVIVGSVGVLSFYFFSGKHDKFLISFFLSLDIIHRITLKDICTSLFLYHSIKGKIGEELNIEDQLNVEMNYYFVPVIIITLGAYFIADVFFGVYEMAVDTLFLCFLEVKYL